MVDEKPNKYEPLPIPTYDEAIGSSSRTPTPLRVNESSEPAEREGLLANDPGGRLPVPTRRAGFRPVGTDDGRDSLENDTFLGQSDERHSTDSERESVQREIEEMEIQEPPQPQSAWGKRISSLSQSLSSINLPFKKLRFPKLDANFCILLSRCFAVLLVMGIVYLLFMSDLFPGINQRMGGQMFDPESVRIYVQKQVDPVRMREKLMKITQNDHLAGTEGDYVLAKYVHDFFQSAGLENVRMEEYDVYLNYPKAGGRKVELLAPDGKVQWSAKIEEDNMYTDPPRQETPVFHGHSKTGDVTGPLIYANYGSKDDYKRLADQGIETKGAIALVRHYGSQKDRALKIKDAELAGFVGCIVYSDPADDGFVQGEVAPNGKFMPEGAAQRGSVGLRSWVIGDILTPGFASIKGAKRVPKENNPGLVNIPSLPLSWGDAKELLKGIQGFGQSSSDNWKGGIPDIGYWSGNSSSPKVHLVNQQDEVDEQRIWNVMAKITGIEQGEKSVIIGNHRDAWVYGASDPGSGTAAMLELVTIFGDLMSRGWRPLRTIEFASWDGGEYNLIGSTEYVENNVEALRKDAYVYLNVDSGVAGQEFRARGSPVFRKSLLRVLDRITDPLQNVTLRELWDRRGRELDGLGASSDYVAFQDIAGTSSLDISFLGPHPYHSAYDNFEYMDNTGDPGFVYHGLLAQAWILLVLEFSDRLILPFDISTYSAALTQWTMDLENWATSKGAATQLGDSAWSTNPLREAVLQFNNDARNFEKWELEWDAVVLGNNGFESTIMGAHRKSHNNRMANFETHLLDLDKDGGLPNRTQFKHILFAPELWDSNIAEYFPAIRDAINEGNWALAKVQVEKAAAIIKRASKKLIGNT
ncbi:hypothetical protein B0O99DRAFT_597923 [Bisporella sp. PMI_857]|nr:hypothetical protein B0O99DRAFT_597923 [Bisporella sp. PMI_857]